MTSNYEKYIAGEPLNEELAAIRAGRLPEFEMKGFAGLPLDQLTISEPQDGAEKPLSREERLALREMRVSPGWPVLQKLLSRCAGAHKKAAIILSEDDPAAAGSRLQDAWLNVKVFKQLVAQLNWLIVLELQSLEEGFSHGRTENDPAVKGT